MNHELVENKITSLIGEIPWRVRLGVGSFLTMEFGQPTEKKGDQPQHGEWHLWLYMCNWRLETPTGIIVGSSDEHLKMERILDAINWGRLVQVNVSDLSLDLVLSFDNDYQLRTFSSSSDEERQWILYTPDKMAMTINSNGLWDYEPRDLAEDV